MLALALTCAAILGDPVLQVQLRYPAYRTTITTASGFNVTYTLAAGTPPELWRAYKTLEAAEREVLITEALQLLKLEIVQNERRLEALRAARLATYLTDSHAARPSYSQDPALNAPRESSLKFCVSEILASDARIERGLAAIDRFVDAHALLRQTLIDLAYPDRRSAVAGARPAAAVVVKRPAPAVSPARVPVSLADAEKAEKAAAAAEVAAEERERNARQEEAAAEARYRDSLPADRTATKAAWLKARDAWEQARRDWDAACDAWKAARDQLSKASR